LASASANRRGILAILAGTAAFSANDTIVKLTIQKCPLGEVLFVRGVMTCALVGGLIAALGHVSHLRLAADRVVFARSCGEALATLCFTSALLHMPLATLSTIAMLSPLVLTALSVVFFGEIVGWRRWSAITVGFIGTLFVVKPTPSAFDAWALLGVLCALSTASRDLVTRKISLGIPTIVVSFTSAAAVMLSGLLLGLAETWRVMQTEEVALLALASIFLATGNFFVVLAYRSAEVSMVAPFRYTVLIWSTTSGYLVFGELPDRFAAYGALLIVGSGIYAVHREALRRRAASPSG
jgi:drug/metabolite transporter (DMT)-like permease